ncbi:hypothetical protein [Microbacterium rhizomatis]|uniref:Uncharacterized protein n=1 Tax=Microbacterium rhizomatis TaxID=1631477 RepID=A0A5J5J2Q0_9MICO|nr:hypothetical protein [Microbacterium rhizomatis]KAA9107959.1 hypothetical protein F6B43_11075 [Microbacterium rhizomatis]
MEPGHQTPRFERVDLRSTTLPLKARLEEDPNDEGTREALVSIYRQAGHLDQAGRYAIGLPGEPRNKDSALTRR